jgi:hypothetical protein
MQFLVITRKILQVDPLGKPSAKEFLKQEEWVKHDYERILLGCGMAKNIRRGMRNCLRNSRYSLDVVNLHVLPSNKRYSTNMPFHRFELLLYPYFPY